MYITNCVWTQCDRQTTDSFVHHPATHPYRSKHIYTRRHARTHLHIPKAKIGHYTIQQNLTVTTTGIRGGSVREGEWCTSRVICPHSACPWRMCQSGDSPLNRAKKKKKKVMHLRWFTYWSMWYGTLWLLLHYCTSAPLCYCITTSLHLWEWLLCISYFYKVILYIKSGRFKAVTWLLLFYMKRPCLNKFFEVNCIFFFFFFFLCVCMVYPGLCSMWGTTLAYQSVILTVSTPCHYVLCPCFPCRSLVTGGCDGDVRVYKDFEDDDPKSFRAGQQVYSMAVKVCCVYACACLCADIVDLSGMRAS